MDESSVSARPRRRRYVGIGIIAAVILLAAGGLAVASTPLMCGTCHTVAPSHEGWQGAAHKDVWCLSCHADPGALGWVSALMGGAGDLATYLGDRPEHYELSTEVPPERCIACHEEVWADPAFTSWHSPADSRCDVCHRATYHRNERVVYPEIVSEIRNVAHGESVTCAECHTNRQMLRAELTADPRVETAAAIQGIGEG